MILYFQVYILSDHYVVWIKLSLDELFGHDNPELITPDITNLQLNYLRTVKAFKYRFEEFINKHNLPEKLYHLQKTG